MRGRIITISHPEDGKIEIIYPDGQVLTLTQTDLTVGEDAKKVVTKVETLGITANITYTDTGEPLGFKKDNTSYFFRRNLQGDIIAILDSSGNVVVKYAYDVWGNHKVLDANGVEISATTHVGHLNPIRYRGYYYDVETGLYYLQSRYYDPEVGRFISPDSVDYLDPDSINGLNLYAYCGNDPINRYDPTGHFGILAIIGIVGAAMFLGGEFN